MSYNETCLVVIYGFNSGNCFRCFRSGLHGLCSSAVIFASWNTGVATLEAIADGYRVASKLADGYDYVIGKGLTETTVTTPETSLPKGTENA